MRHDGKVESMKWSLEESELRLLKGRNSDYAQRSHFRLNNNWGKKKSRSMVYVQHDFILCSTHLDFMGKFLPRARCWREWHRPNDRTRVTMSFSKPTARGKRRKCQDFNLTLALLPRTQLEFPTRSFLIVYFSPSVEQNRDIINSMCTKFLILKKQPNTSITLMSIMSVHTFV